MTVSDQGLERYLPALYHSDPFWGRFLRPFERLLSLGATIDGAVVDGLETTIDQMHLHFVPEQTPKPFLGWLGTWVALSLREDWDETTQRAMIRVIASLYPLRGTRDGLQRVLNLYLAASDPSPPAVTIVEPVSMQIGGSTPASSGHSTVGVDTWVGGGGPHRFTVRVDFTVVNPAALELRPRAVVDIVDREKPAHTYYDLDVRIPTLRVGVRSHVGQDTVLGNKLV